MAGKTTRALHLYEEKGLLSPAERSKGGFRLYDEHNVARIDYIDRLQRLGYRLIEIQTLVSDWTGSETPRAAMDALGRAYRSRLTEVKEQLTDLSKLKAELEASIGFIAGCSTCEEEVEPTAACGCCVRPDETLTLIHGVAGG